MKIIPVAVLLIAATSLASAADERNKPQQAVGQVEISAPVTPYIFDGDVRDLPRPKRWRPGDPVREIPRRGYIRPGSRVPIEYEPGIDPLLEAQHNTPTTRITNFTSPSRNFPGQGYSGVNPPDTVGEVGPNHYIQMINDSSGTSVVIYDKAEPTPNELATFMLDTLGSGNCASGHGDPIVLYDRLADRWMLQEFATSGNWLCVYISQTSDPVSGGWYNYNYNTPSFPDYPKYGVWPTDANGGMGSYVVTSNESTSAGYALDRGAMLTGSASTFQRVTMPDLSGFNFQTATPADLDGPEPPPPYAPAIIMRHRDTENHGGPAAPGDLLEYWSFDVDWITPANTTFTEETAIDIAEIDSELCGLTAFYCFPQPDSSTTLDPLREVIMWRLQYMNHGDHETLVGNLVTDIDGTDHGGLRWFELRGGHGAWYLHQEGTYSIDDDHRWMAASAMDQSGNIAIAYNVSSDTTYPSLRYTGRLSDDALGVMTVAETVIHDGTSRNSSNRYGDYSSMNLDPEDDCTFWFTGEDNTSTSWRTQIASFRFEACGCELFPNPLAPIADNNGDNRIDVSWDDSELETIVEYLVRRSRTSGGPYETIATVPDSSPGAGGGAGYVYDDTDVSGGITYYYVVIASDGSACKSSPANEVSATGTGACILEPLFGGVQNIETPFSGVCTLDISWDPGTPECAGPLTYNVYRSTDPGFTVGPANLLAEGITGNTMSDIDGLVSGTAYYYVVRAVDSSNGREEDNGIELYGRPLGQLTTGTWYDDAGDIGDAKMIMESPWSIDPAEGNVAPNVYKTGTYGNSSCVALTTPQLRLGSGSVLTFWSKYEIENSYDKGEVQISVDGGLFYERVELAYPGTSTNASDNCGLPTGDYFTGDGLTWVEYTADLSAWAGADALLRFVLSSDGSQTRTGWWIDDISITSVDVPGTCATGSTCEDNPFVDVDPEGPMTVCTLDSPLLTAMLSSGSGPYSYQWYQDAFPIAGATTSTYRPADLGTHAYNAKVKSNSCEDDVMDGFDTVVTLENAPHFGGLTSVYDSQLDDCSVTVEWSPASTVCHGPLNYFVYRDASPGVSPTPENLVASGLTGTSWLDDSGLLENNTYYYKVRVLDRSTWQSDSNTIEASATPTGPGTGIYPIFTEDFEDAGTWSQWTVTTGPGAHTCGDWVRSNASTERPSGGSGYYAVADSEACHPMLPVTSTKIDSPAIDLTIGGLNSVTLEYDIYYKYFDGGDTATVEVWDGSAWQVLWTDTDADHNTHHSYDVTSYAAGNPAFQVRFNLQQANSDRWFSVDNVEVIVDIYNSCATGASPPPAPDGSGTSSPLRGDRLTVSGDRIEASWDVSSCAAGDYNLLYGNLGGLPTYTLSGSECSIGTSGSYTWRNVPDGNLFFLIVGSDGGVIESSWGVDNADAERNGMSASGMCSATAKDISNHCP
jgi:hypothetical protein